jgi:F-type H+-transporting ATPase subunit epsilon
VERLSLEIITPERVVVRDEVDMVEGRGALGEFGILPGHARFLTILDIGEVRYMKDGVTKHLAASGGFGEVAQDKVTFLLDTAELAEEIDIERARRAEQKAETALRELNLEGTDYRRHELALLRAIARIKVASKGL